MIDLKTVSRLTHLVAMLVASAALTATMNIANAEGNPRNEKIPQPATNNFTRIEKSVANTPTLPCTQTNSNLSSRARPVATVSNGVTTSTIFNGPGGLELSANAPGTITVTHGSNSVTLRGNAVTLSGAIALAPGATPGVTVTPNAQGGYTVVRNTPCNSPADAALQNEIVGGGHLMNECAIETGHDIEDMGNEFDR